MLYPVYIRGQAYLAAGQGAQAAEEFQKIVSHPGLVGSDPIGALARLQVGRAWTMAGDLTTPGSLCGVSHAMERRRRGSRRPPGGPGRIRPAPAFLLNHAIALRLPLAAVSVPLFRPLGGERQPASTEDWLAPDATTPP